MCWWCGRDVVGHERYTSAIQWTVPQTVHLVTSSCLPLHLACQWQVPLSSECHSSLVVTEFCHSAKQSPLESSPLPAKSSKPVVICTPAVHFLSLSRHYSPRR